MSSFTANFCCNRLALTISMLITDMLGRLNFGAKSAQAPSATAKARATHRASRNKVRVGRGNMPEMIPTLATRAFMMIGLWTPLALSAAHADVPQGAAANTQPVACLVSGDGYLRAQVGGAIEARLDWPNS